MGLSSNCHMTITSRINNGATARSVTPMTIQIQGASGIPNETNEKSHISSRCGSGHSCGPGHGCNPGHGCGPVNGCGPVHGCGHGHGCHGSCCSSIIPSKHARHMEVSVPKVIFLQAAEFSG